jgi:Zn-dependent M28 family amino/carboxypeptidase
VTVPVIGTSFAVGEELVNAAKAGPVTVRVSTSTQSETRTAKKVFGDTKAGDADRKLLVGAHLDSVVEGPGINDNGSGTSGILEIADQMSELGVKPRQQVRFAFWGAEESGLLGSEHYVENLTDEAREQIFANLNFDMIGSPNSVRFVYDGDGSKFEAPGPPGVRADRERGVRPLLRLAGAGHGGEGVRRALRSSAARPGSPTTRTTTSRATPSRT